MSVNLPKGVKESTSARVTRIAFIAVPIVVVIAIVSVIGFTLFNNRTTDLENGPSGVQLEPQLITENGYRIVNGSVSDVAAESDDSDARRVDMFFDLQCPGCAFVDAAINDRLKELSVNNEIDLYLTPVSFLDQSSGDNYSSRGASAVITVAENEGDKLLDFMKVMYENQPSEGGATTADDNTMRRWALDAGVSQETADLIVDRSYTEWVLSNTETQKQREDLFPSGIGTPAVFIDTEFVNGEAVDYNLLSFGTGSDPLAILNDALAS